MARRGPAVNVSLDTTEIDRMIRVLGASPEQVKWAIRRALRRTTTTLRLRTRQAVASEVQARTLAAIRRRLKDLRTSGGKSGDVISIWVGLNNMAISQLKGRVSEYADGATFRSMEYPKAFVAKVGRYRSIYRRRGDARFPIAEETYPIKGAVDPVLRDKVLPNVADVFLRHFLTDLRARTVFGVGRGGRNAAT